MALLRAQPVTQERNKGKEAFITLTLRGQSCLMLIALVVVHGYDPGSEPSKTCTLALNHIADSRKILSEE